MNKYSDTQIYMLRCPDGYFYYGHTINNLRYRKSNHKSDSKSDKYKTQPVYKHINDNNIDWKDIEIVLIEKYPCNNKDEARAKENEYIIKHKNDIKCLNFNHSVRDIQQDKDYSNEYNKKKGAENQQRYREAHPDKVKAYYEANKEKMLIKNAERIKCEICNKELRRDSMSKHIKSQHNNNQKDV